MKINIKKFKKVLARKKRFYVYDKTFGAPSPVKPILPKRIISLIKK